MKTPKLKRSGSQHRTNEFQIALAPFHLDDEVARITIYNYTDNTMKISKYSSNRYNIGCNHYRVKKTKNGSI